jgi:hypothetical protein
MNLKMAHHIFTKCPFTRQVWAKLALIFKEQSFNHVHWEGHDNIVSSWYRSVRKATVPENKKSTPTVTKLICWELWKERNRRVFDKKELSV